VAGKEETPIGLEDRRLAFLDLEPVPVQRVEDVGLVSDDQRG